MMEAEADREPEKEKPKRKALSMEDLRKKYSWWPSGNGNGGEPIVRDSHGGGWSRKINAWHLYTLMVYL